MLSFIDRLTQHPKVFLYAGIIGLLLVSPSLFVGYFADDYTHHVLINHQDLIKQPDNLSLFHLYTFLDADSERRDQLLSVSLIPWWTSEHFNLAFWRPLSEITHYFDYTLLQDYPFLMHVQNLIWYGLLLLLLVRFYTTFCPNRFVAVLAFIFFIADSTHGVTISWLANRHSIIAAVFSIAALLLHHRFRTSDQWRYGVLSVLCVIAAFLGSEAGISAGILLFAYALFYDKSGPLKSFVYLLPALGVFIIWFTLYNRYGYGAAGNEGYYADPISSTGTFFKNLLTRFPSFLAVQFNLVPLHHKIGYGQPIALIGLFIGVLLILLAFKQQDKSLNFFITLLVLAILPISSAEVQERNTLFLGIASSAILAHLIQFLRSRYDEKHRQPVPQLMIVIVVFFHLFLSGAAMLPMTYAQKIYTDITEDIALSFPDKIKNKRVISMGIPLFDSAYLVQVRKVHDAPIPDRFWNLVTYTPDLTIERTGERSIHVYSPNPLLGGQDYLVRPIKQEPFRIGDSIDINGAEVKVMAVTPEGIPTAISMEWEPVPPGIEVAFFHTSEGKLTPYTLAIGEKRRLF